MTEKEKAAYDRITRCLEIDPLALEDEFLELPMLMKEINDWIAEYTFQRDKAKTRGGIAYSEAADEIRRAGATSEARVTADLARHDKAQRASTDNDERQYELALWKALGRAVETKETSLKEVVKLITAGYYVPSTSRKTSSDAARRQTSKTSR